MIEGSVSKLGIIAGGGDLPNLLVDSAREQGIDVFLVGFDGQTDDVLLLDKQSLTTKIGQVGKVTRFFQKSGVKDLVLIGALNRPSFSELVPDLKAAKFLLQNAGKAMGDSELLSALKIFLEKEGFQIHGIQDFVPDLLVNEGCITKTKPSKDDWLDINHGIRVLQETAALDIGQSVIVQEGLVLGLEAIEGTNLLIERCAALKRKGRKGVLVKLCKAQQDISLDLPTIGLQTIRAIHKAGFGGIVVNAQKTLICEREALISYANKHHLYVLGINP